MHIAGQPVTATVPKPELDSRTAKLQKTLCSKGLGGALIVEKTDLYYFAGTSQQGWLYVPAEGQPLLMIFKDYDRACQESTVERIVSISGTKKIPSVLGEYGCPLPEKLGMELDVLPAALYFQYNTIFTDSKIEDISLEIRLTRAIKSPYEIDKIRKAAELSDKVAAHVETCLQAGMTEVALAGQLEGYCRSLGHQGVVRMRMFNNELFYGHLMCGDSAAVPSYLASPTGGRGVSSVIGQGAGFARIKENQPVLVDYVFALDGYLSDHTRIFSLGKIDEELCRAHEAMVQLQNRIKNLARPGVLTGELYEEMVAFAAEKKVGDHFMGFGQRKIRFTGHGVGLELDEFPFIAKGQKMALEEGMVIALEPKAIYPGKGVVGIENTHVVTGNGLETLTQFPDDIKVLK
ncbi:M24 family metallopeptidase [Desulforhopalus singaporensis]|uniref:Xaa-Pro aminopeptidase n=1 Tax=Desulforhopalus singaporensis TaxID=91360 RepID=A0A1H0P2E8_9BACT|nr:Xaa-Pro peptidase family protein [Desulforhopalus singaporensis]SDO98830.1 Xaa-Pro aminopeptidase [Desulforhopalus singaporensis]